MLAAGRARRFGSDKRFARLPDGRLLLQASVEAVLASGLPLRLCLRRGDERALALLPDPERQALYCPGAEAGMGHTLAQAAAQVPEWDGLLVALADMPFVLPATYRALAGALTSSTIWRPVWQGTPGHPVGFGSELIPQLCALDGDVGARGLIAASPERLRLLDTDDRGVLRDIDQASDLTR